MYSEIISVANIYDRSGPFIGYIKEGGVKGAAFEVSLAEWDRGYQEGKPPMLIPKNDLKARIYPEWPR